MSKLYKLDIITRPSMLDDFAAALHAAGVKGMTVNQVFGCGVQKGHQEVYRGKTYNISLVQKVKIEIVIGEKYLDRVLELAQEFLHTGEAGDGKIFIFELHDAVRIRTGERGIHAILESEIEAD